MIANMAKHYQLVDIKEKGFFILYYRHTHEIVYRMLSDVELLL